MLPFSDCIAGDLALLTPKQVVEELDRFIVGQREAKRAGKREKFTPQAILMQV